MQDLHTHHHIFEPLQPSIQEGSPSICQYFEQKPSEALARYIHCYWTLYANSVLTSPFYYRIISDGCIDLFINCSIFEKLTLAGTADVSTTVALSGKIKYFGIRFYPGTFNLFFPLHLKEIANSMVPCTDIFGDHLADFEERLFTAKSFEQRINICESFLLSQFLKRNSAIDNRFFSMLHKIISRQGDIPIENEKNNGISSRQLRRLFDLNVGISPKAFARIIRFQFLLHSIIQNPQANQARLCLDYGYYDQSHFIRDFKNFYGLPPGSVRFQ